MLGLLRPTKKPQQAPRQKVIIYTDTFFRGSLLGEEVKGRSPNAIFRTQELTAWEHGKSMKDNRVMKWVDEVLIPELNKKGTLKPLVVWKNERNGKKYVIDGHHRLIAYKKAGWNKEIPAVVVDKDEIIMTDWTPGSGRPHPFSS